MYDVIRKLLFKMDAEKAHEFSLKNLETLSKIPGLVEFIFGVSSLKTKEKVEFAGLSFPNRVGLAAGLDKSAEHFDALSKLGFGFVEIGTITPEAQVGNDKPRLFRLLKDDAIINRMGFNNVGMEKAFSNLQNRKGSGIVGVNIGKNKNTPAEEAVNDYLKCFEKLYSVADYFTVNVSSPNTPGLRSLQEKGPLNEIIKALMVAREKKEKHKPVFLKIAPDLNWAEVDDVIEIALENNLSGIIATNTTISRENLGTSISEIEKIGAGGLSGRPLNHLSTSIVEYISKQTNQKLGIIASGGIMSPSHAMQKIDAGATLVQLYTGFIYNGPKLITDCRKQLMNNL